MTVVEIRLTTPARLPEALTLPAAAISVGQEGCLTKLPDAPTLREIACQIRGSGRRAVIVAPIAWPATSTDLLRRVRTVAEDGPVTIVVNDLGTARSLTAQPVQGAELVAGQGLTRARPHSGSTDGTAAPAPVLDLALLELLGQWGINAAEIDLGLTAGEREAAAAAGIELRQAVDATALAFSRSCPTARHHRTGPPDCSALCDVPYHLTAEQRWQLNHGHLEPLPAGTRRPEFTVWGNAVYQPNQDARAGGYRILDARWHSPHSLAQTVRHLQEQ